MKKFLKIILYFFIALAVAILVIWGKDIRTIASVHQVGDNPFLFEMSYSSEYDLDELLSCNLSSNKELMTYIIGKVAKGLAPAAASKIKAGNSLSVEERCTSFQARNAEGGWLYGRNYDFFKNPTLVVHNHPSKGYASLSVCDMSHFGYDLEKLPADIVSKAMCIASVYAPMDGINEKGLCTSIMALPKQPACQNTGKQIAGTSILMRLWLDRCATVDEAINLLKAVDVRHDQEAGSGYHYMVADANGSCAVIEFDPKDGWKTMITRKKEGANFMHVTNHLLDPEYYTTEPDPEVGNPHSKSWWRYETVAEFMADHNDGVITSDEAQECLASVHWKDLKWENGLVEDTQYSNVYDQSALTLKMRSWNDYDNTVLFTLE